MISIRLFINYIQGSFKEIKNNFKIYLIYIIGLSLVSIVQNSLDFILPKNDFTLRAVSKILFSLVPILILSKILYVIKIRNTGMGEYGKLLLSFLMYNLYYFILFFVAVFVYLLPATIISSMTNSSLGYLAMAFLLIPLFYTMIYYSLTPFVAAFETREEINFFSESKIISKRNVTLVIINHICSLLVPLLSSLFFIVKNPLIKLYATSVFSIPEAILSIVMVLTTSKIYYYLSEIE